MSPRLPSPLAIAFTLALGAAATAPSRAADAPRRLELWAIDVEGGAATLIVTPAGESILIDSGNPGERDAGRIVKAAREAKLEAIDIAITTHFHLDHVGGIPRVAQLIPVKSFYDNGVPEPLLADLRADDIAAYRKATGGKAKSLKPGEEIPLRTSGSLPLKLRCVAAGGKVVGEADGAAGAACAQGHEARPPDPSDNARSLALVLSIGDFQLFCGGDLTWNVEHRLACPEKRVPEVDVFLVNHHGLDQSNHPALVAALKPRVALMNCGARKGCERKTFATLKGAAGLEAIFQLHRNLRVGDDGNTLAAHIANDADPCQGQPLRLVLAEDAKSYEVSVPAKGTKVTFACR